MRKGAFLDRLCPRLWVATALLAVVLGLGGGSEALASPLAAAIVSWEYDQIAPAAAYSPTADEYLVVWEDHHWGWGDNWDIYGRRAASDGTTIGDIFGISWDTWAGLDNHRLAPDVAYNSTDNEYLVVLEYAYSATDHDLLGRRVGVDGTLPDVDFGINLTTAYNSAPAVAYNPTLDSYLVVYEQLAGSDEFQYHDIYGVIVSAAGVPGTPFSISATTSEDKAAPDVAYSQSAGTFLVTWQEERSTAGFDILGRAVTGAGSLTGSLILVGCWDGDQILPRIAYSGDSGEYLVVWEDHHWGEASGWDVYGQRVTAAGALSGSAIIVANHDTQAMTNPDVAYNATTRNYIVVWEYAYGSADHDVYSRRVAYDGTRPDAMEAVSTTGYYEGAPTLASNNGSGLWVVWEDGRNTDTETMGLDLYGEGRTVTLPALSGTVYEGSEGNTSAPIAGVTVELYCSSDSGAPGTRVTTKTTNDAGAYSLPVPGQCEFYNILETDPEGDTSTGAASVSGTIVNSNWIQYTHPLAGKTWAGNNFWDMVEGPTDTIPPGNWTNYTPANWVNVRAVPVSAQVEDGQSGLDVGSAVYSYSNDNGSVWSDWETAACTGSGGTTGPQTISATAHFAQDGGAGGPNRVLFQINDVAGNPGTSAEVIVKIDTVAPANPTSLTSSSHTVNTWSQDATADTAWSGATDDRSGVSGYAYAWSHTSTTVPEGWDTADSSVADYPLSDADDWYFHVRSIDAAGNVASGAKHFGPIEIDTEAPTAWLTAPTSGSLNTRTFSVSWAGGDTLSGVAGYDVQTSTNGTAWTNWQQSVTSQTSAFTGEPGKTYYFRVRARDQAANVGAWSSVVQVTVGVPVTVRVRNEVAAVVQGAKVYYANQYVGLTNAAGLVAIPYAVLGDSLAATSLVYTQPAAKPNHGWSWRVYLTSVDIPDNGTPQLFTISNTGATYQDLTVRKDQALVGVHIVTWVEWDASSDFLTGVVTGVRGASAYLYDVTDGQIFYELVEIFDNGQNGAAGDMNIYASTEVWPNAFVGAITDANFGRMYLPRNWGGTPWSSRNAWGTMIHEFGHYGLHLFDEYLDRNGMGGGFCTHNRGIGMAGEPTRASIMDNSDNASELCSEADSAHLHNTNTEQDARNGESTWRTVIRKYSDSQTPSRWALQSPDTRHVAVVSGPVALPVSTWMSVSVTDANTSVCAPYTETVVYTSSGLPVDTAEITLERLTGPNIYEGVTNSTGRLVILGAHNGDTLRAKKGNLSGAWAVSCTPGGLSEQGVTTPGHGIEPDPFDLAVSVTPLGGSTVRVQVQATVDLPAAPVVALWQTGAADSIPVAVTFDGGLGLYAGQAELDPILEPQGQVEATATHSTGGTVWQQQAFSIQPVVLSQAVHLYSADGNFELVLPAGALDADATVAIQPSTAGTAAQDGLVRVGLAYRTIVSTGQSGLNAPAVVNMRYSDTPQAPVNPGTLRLYRWDADQQRWLPAGDSQGDTAQNLISTEVEDLAVYALLGVPGSGTVYLPLVLK